MIHEAGDDLNSIYKLLVARVALTPEHVSRPRDQQTKEVLNANITLRNPRARLITSPTRNVNYGFAAGEFTWYWTGRNDLEYIQRYNTRLKNFSDDGLTLNSGYGKRIFGRHRHDQMFCGQWDVAARKLVLDNDSRQAIIHVLRQEDLISPTKDVPCTCSFQFFLRDDRLYMHAHMRSNDIFWGLPYDVFSFTLFQEAMAMDLSDRLGRTIELGEYYHTVGSLHIYERHFEDAGKICSEVNVPSTPMPAINSLHSLWRVCNIDPYVSLDQPVPEALRVNSGPTDTAEGWLYDQLVKHWHKRNSK